MEGEGGAPHCIICGLEKDGLDVREDFVIKSIRLFKRHVMRNEKGYRLVVCRECYPKYRKERDRFVRRQVTYLAIGFILAATFVLLSRAKLLSLLYAAIIVLFLYLLSLINYVPALQIPMQGQAGGASIPQTHAKQGKIHVKSQKKRAG